MKLVLAGDLMSVNPVLPVRWCLSKSETEMLKSKEAKTIHILFVIAYEGTDLEDRSLVPIDQMMAYLNLRRPGKHTVFAKVVWSRGGPQAKEYLLQLVRKYSYRSHEKRLLDRESHNLVSDEYFYDNHCVNVLPHTEKVEVMVPKEHFPPEPAEWWKNIVNLGYSYPPIDQCEFRQRTMLLPLRIVIFGIGAVISTVAKIVAALFFALCGMRGIDFKAILHPFSKEVGDVIENVDGNNSWFERTADGRPRKSGLIYALHPMIYIVGFVIITIVGWYYEISYGEMLRFIPVLLATLKEVLFQLGIPIIFSFLFTVSAFFLFKRLAARRFQKAHVSSADEWDQKKKDAKYDDLYKLLACRNGISADLSAIPMKNRTFHLRFLDIKAKICRPFAAS
jgi:hypothetical protein